MKKFKFITSGLLFFTLLAPAFCANSHEEDFRDMFSSFCASEKAQRVLYKSVLTGNFFATPAKTGELDLSYQCPAKMRAQLKHAPYELEFITDGVQAWVIVSDQKSKSRIIERYDSLKSRHLGDWTRFFAQLSEGKALDPTAKVSLKKDSLVSEKGDLMKSYKLEHRATGLMLSLIPSLKSQGMLLQELQVNGTGFLFELKHQKTLLSGKAFDASHFTYILKTGERETVFKD